MVEALALPLGINVALEAGGVIKKEGEGAITAIIEFFRGFNFNQRLNKTQNIRDILRNLSHSYPEYNIAILEEGVYFLDTSRGLEEIILDQTFSIDGFRRSRPFTVRMLIFKKGYITILDHALNDSARWGKTFLLPY